MDVPKIAVISASLGGFDKPVEHTNQLVKADYFMFTDENFPRRFNAMTPRLQAKIPKMFGWQLKPGYDYYLWLDGNLRLAHQESIQYFLDALENHDIAVLKHPDRDTVHWEYRYNWRALHSNAPSNYMKARYENEFLDEQMAVLDPNDQLVNGGVFMYRNTPAVWAMLKEWFYHVCRYQVNDQIPLPYVLKQSGLRANVLPDVFRDCMWLENMRHAK
jgi:hypothetical protein